MPYSGYPLHEPRGVFFYSDLRFSGRQSTVGQEKNFSPFLEHSKKILAFKQFLQYFATGSDTSSCQDYEEWDECCCQRELTHCKLQMNNHINFLNIRSQLILVLTSSGFYSITWRMISKSAGYKIHFRKQPPFRGNFRRDVTCTPAIGQCMYSNSGRKNVMSMRELFLPRSPGRVWKNSGISNMLLPKIRCFHS